LSLIAALGLAACTDGGDSTVGPCLSQIEDTDTDEPDTDASADVGDALQEVLHRGVLPADVAERLRRKV